MEMKTLVQKLKVVLFFMGVVSVVCLTLNSLPSYAQDDTAMKTLIVYYSRTGNTKTACEVLQKELGCDILEIRDLKSRAGGWGFFTAALGSMFNTHTKIDPEHPDLAAYGAVIIGSPVWAGRPAAAIRTFIANNRFDGKKIVLFTTTNVFEKEGSQNRAKTMVGKSGGTVAGYFQIAVTEKINGEKVQRPQQLLREDAVKLAVGIKAVLTQ